VNFQRPCGSSHFRRELACATALVLLLGRGGRAHAACNLIPTAPRSFRAALGTVNRPFTGPGEFVELAVRQAGCDAASPGFVAQTPSDYVVTVVFTPPVRSRGPNSVVILAAGCTRIADAVQGCAARPDVGTATCIEMNPPHGPHSLELVRRDGEVRLSLRFPGTDPLVGERGDHRTYTGPATIAVTTAGAPLPCALASTRCAERAGMPGLVACVDDLFAVDGTCETSRASLDQPFGHFTALPPPNDYRAIIDPAGEVRFTVDAAGNVLVPIDWRGVLDGGVSRRLRGSAAVQAFLDFAGPIRIPGQAFLASYTLGGLRLPPLFDPRSGPAAASEVTLFGSTDVPFTVLRLARRSPSFHECSGGSDPGLPCVTAGDCRGGACGPATCVGGGKPGTVCGGDADCPGGECGSALFEFRDRLAGGVGPVVISRPQQASAMCEAGMASMVP